MFGQFAVNEDPFLGNTADVKVQEKKDTKIIDLLCSPATGKVMIQEEIQIFAAWEWTIKKTTEA